MLHYRVSTSLELSLDFSYHPVAFFDPPTHWDRIIIYNAPKSQPRTAIKYQRLKIY